MNQIIKKLLLIPLISLFLSSSVIADDEYTFNPFLPFELDNRGLTQGTADTLYPLRTEWLQNGFPNLIDSDISFVGTTTFSIQPSATSFDYFDDGVKYTSTGDTVDIDGSEGLHLFYYSGDTLVAIANPTDAQTETATLSDCLVAYIYFDATNNLNELIEDRHGILMSPATHRELHFTAGTTYFDGLAIGDITADQNGNTDSHAQFSVATGQIFDEDIKHTTNTIGSTTGLEVWYRNVSLDWRKDTQAGFSVLNASAGRVQYDNNGTLTEVTDAKFVLYHIFATSNADLNPIAIMGQAQYDNQKAARQGAITEINSLLLGSLPAKEMKTIATVIFQTKDTYSNSVKARIRTTDEGDDYVDWRTAEISPSAPAIDHGSLSGLEDDDHPYILADGTKSLTGDWNLGAFDLTGGVDADFTGTITADKLGVGTASLIGNGIDIKSSPTQLRIDVDANSEDVVIDFAPLDSGGGFGNSKITATAPSGTQGEMYFSTRQAGGNVVEALRIDSTQQVGIGTATPDVELSVVGSAEIGGSLDASGNYSMATGFSNEASGSYSFSTGQENTSSGYASATFGAETTASTNEAFAWGYLSTASGDYSMAGGKGSVSSGYASVAEGYEVKAEAVASAAFGHWNVGGGTAASWVLTDPVFEIGIGTADGSRANALTVFKNGNFNFHAGDLSTIGTLGAGATTVTSLDAGSGTIQTTGAITDGTFSVDAGVMTGIASLDGAGTIDLEDNLDGTGFTITGGTVDVARLSMNDRTLSGTHWLLLEGAIGLGFDWGGNGGLTIGPGSGFSYLGIDEDFTIQLVGTSEFELAGAPLNITGTAGQSTIDKGLIVNDGGGGAANDDFRVETDNEAYALFFDASANTALLYVSTTFGNASTETFSFTGRMIVRSVTDGGMDATAGSLREIVFNTDDTTFYGCTVGGSPATWAAFH